MATKELHSTQWLITGLFPVSPRRLEEIRDYDSNAENFKRIFDTENAAVDRAKVGDGTVEIDSWYRHVSYPRRDAGLNVNRRSSTFE